VNATTSGRNIRRFALGAVLCAAALCPIPCLAAGQVASPPPSVVFDVNLDLPAANLYKGRRVEQVRVLGNTQVSTEVILNAIRTREGDPFDPSTAIEDYQRIYDLRKFSNVEARLEPTATGVIVTFIVTEQQQIREIRFVGNKNVSTPDLLGTADLTPGEAIDPFKISLAQQQIEKVYKDHNYAFAHVSVDGDALERTGDVVFNIVEGPQVTIRKIAFIGNKTFTAWRLKDQIKSAYYIPIFRSGEYDPEVVEDDVASIRNYYTNKGFFDVRVGRKLTFSADQTDLQITFLIDEGPRYQIDHVIFKGAHTVSEGTLRNGLNLLEGSYYDKDILDRDIRQIVKDYSPYGFIYEEQSITQPNPDYLHIDSHPIFKQPGHMDLVYDISEGREFYVYRIIIKGNERTQDKVVLRELHFAPGQKYDSSEVADAIDRLKGTPYFTAVSITPIGGDENGRDLLVQVTEQHTASINAGVGINSDGGLGGDLSYEQRNFDIANPPPTFSDMFTGDYFTGAGQDFKASFEPGTIATDASLSFSEPYLFDQPYSFGSEVYLSNTILDHYTDRRLGLAMSFGKQFDYVYSAGITLKAEDVDIRSVPNQYVEDANGNPIYAPDGELLDNRAPEIIQGEGHHTLTATSIFFRRDTTDHGPLPYRGNNSTITFTKVGAMGGTVDYNRIQFTTNDYQALSEDLLDRRTILNSHLEFGDDLSRAPFYERFYGGGLYSIRGFAWRGVSPREGPHFDAVGGNFSLTGGEQLSFPLAEDILRGVVFTDVGDVESDARIGVIRSSVGAGFSIILPFLNNAPLDVYYAVPMSSGPHDKHQRISFDFGITQ